MLTGGTISASGCTIEWNTVFKTGQTASTYIVAIMGEDFSNTGRSALSAVSLEMAIYVYSAGSGACVNDSPQVIGARSNRACIASASVHRPNRNGTYVKIYHQNGTMVWSIDCSWSPDVFYTNQTIIFIVRNPNWDAGALYYINFDNGASSGTAFCDPESAPITSR
ncbi:unnamed protein product [Didymodactylos carnosus]|uniref:Uncharacterized protein n=1 Tax=Didymodactylos carnosus TaxID=1234261 RepID=A0A815XR42_9BILA|nr:unnamed protein product [Didymodactylos carnosus]CAF1560709.1 unnamed protein product [Didymodactylos carnosus]CAF4295382.1 unnamed protein product [Didymodactylos carnosus]CAF4422161.1 unnamed protein product [Didymodactylos carnosus]